MKTVLIFEPTDFSENVISRLIESGFSVILNDGSFGIISAFENFEVIYLRLGVNVSESILKSCKIITTKYLIIPATGIDHIDEISCNQFGVEVISFRNNKHLLKDIRATAELTIALTLNLLRNLPSAITSTKLGFWERDFFRGRDIFGKKVGIIGFGRLGKIVSSYFHCFGANIFVYEKKFVKLPKDYVKCQNLEELFRYSDIITIHVDFNEENRNLINLRLLKMASKNTVLINTSRGQILNEEDLLFALNERLISGAALDVVENELLFNKDNSLVKYSNLNNNLIITPHIGGCTFDSSHKTEEIITELFLNNINR